MTVSKLAFVCEGNAGRSQIATALAERERERRDLDITIVTGGVEPGDHVHETVRAVLAEDGIEIGGRDPRRIRQSDVADADHVVTMGCDVGDIVPVEWSGTAHRWSLEHPSAGNLEAARAQRDEISSRVEQLFEEIETGGTEDP